MLGGDRGMDGMGLGTKGDGCKDGVLFGFQSLMVKGQRKQRGQVQDETRLFIFYISSTSYI